MHRSRLEHGTGQLRSWRGNVWQADPPNLCPDNTARLFLFVRQAFMGELHARSTLLELFVQVPQELQHVQNFLDFGRGFEPFLAAHTLFVRVLCSLLHDGLALPTLSQAVQASTVSKCYKELQAICSNCKRLRAPPRQPGRPQDRKGGKRVSQKRKGRAGGGVGGGEGGGDGGGF